MSEKIWLDDSWRDYLYWQLQDKKTLKRINQLIKDIGHNGRIEGTAQKRLCPLSVTINYLISVFIQSL